MESRKGNLWKTARVTNSKPHRGPMDNRKGGQLETERGRIRTAKKTNGKPQKGTMANRKGCPIANRKGDQWKTAQGACGNRKEGP